MTERFPEKRVFITGAGSGLGLAIARHFGAQGWRVAATDVDPDRARAALQAIQTSGGNGIWAACDVRSAASIEQVRDRLQREWGGVDVIVNNAGVGSAGTVMDTPLEDWEWVLDINLMGVVRGCHIFAPLLVAQGGGHIINIASFAGIAQAPAMAGYNVAKVGVIGLSESLRAEVQPAGVDVSVVCPSFFKTNILEQFRSPAPRLKEVAGKLVNRATATADNVASQIFNGMQKNRFMIITHADARFFYRLKRFAPELSFKLFRRQAARMMGIDKSG